MVSPVGSLHAMTLQGGCQRSKLGYSTRMRLVKIAISSLGRPVGRGLLQSLGSAELSLCLESPGSVIGTVLVALADGAKAN